MTGQVSQEQLAEVGQRMLDMFEMLSDVGSMLDGTDELDSMRVRTLDAFLTQWCANKRKIEALEDELAALRSQPAPPEVMDAAEGLATSLDRAIQYLKDLYMFKQIDRDECGERVVQYEEDLARYRAALTAATREGAG